MVHQFGFGALLLERRDSRHLLQPGRRDLNRRWLRKILATLRSFS
jgi:hypothetical protein